MKKARELTDSSCRIHYREEHKEFMVLVTGAPSAIHSVVVAYETLETHLRNTFPDLSKKTLPQMVEVFRQEFDMNLVSLKQINKPKTEGEKQCH